jgi:dephospho-CoA kinase
MKINKSPKFLIVGSARHGKDTLAELLNELFGLKFQSSSQAASDIFIFDRLKDKYGYETSEECFEDRVNHRQEWYELICEYNKEDLARLAKGILENADCYVGMRDHNEITECMNQGLFDLIIWVDASERLPLEDASSFNIDKSIADIIIENNGTFEEFKDKVKRLGKLIMLTKYGLYPNQICDCLQPTPTMIPNNTVETWLFCGTCKKPNLESPFRESIHN